MTALVVGVSGIALWQRTTLGWIVVAIANAAGRGSGG